MQNIELRWYSNESIFVKECVTNIYGSKMVLQYRERLNPLEIGLHEPIWSDWKTVPFSVV